MGHRATANTSKDSKLWGIERQDLSHIISSPRDPQRRRLLEILLAKSKVFLDAIPPTNQVRISQRNASGDANGNRSGSRGDRDPGGRGVVVRNKSFVFTFEMVLSIIDGEVLLPVNEKADTKVCPICDAKRSKANNLPLTYNRPLKQSHVTYVSSSRSHKIHGEPLEDRQKSQFRKRDRYDRSAGGRDQCPSLSLVPYDTYSA